MCYFLFLDAIHVGSFHERKYKWGVRTSSSDTGFVGTSLECLVRLPAEGREQDDISIVFYFIDRTVGASLPDEAPKQALTLGLTIVSGATLHVACNGRFLIVASQAQTSLLGSRSNNDA